MTEEEKKFNNEVRTIVRGIVAFVFALGVIYSVSSIKSWCDARNQEIANQKNFTDFVYKVQHSPKTRLIVADGPEVDNLLYRSKWIKSNYSDEKWKFLQDYTHSINHTRMFQGGQIVFVPQFTQLKEAPKIAHR